VTVDSVDYKIGKVEEVTSKGGITAIEETTPDKAWKSEPKADLNYWHKPAKFPLCEMAGDGAHVGECFEFPGEDN
jgi:hypothetical protein